MIKWLNAFFVVVIIAAGLCVLLLANSASELPPVQTRALTPVQTRALPPVVSVKLVDRPEFVFELVCYEDTCFFRGALAIGDTNLLQPVILMMVNEPDTVATALCLAAGYEIRPQLRGYLQEWFLFAAKSDDVEQALEKAHTHFLIIVVGRNQKMLVIKITPSDRARLIAMFKRSEI